eukprot:gene30566-254_t
MDRHPHITKPYMQWHLGDQVSRKDEGDEVPFAYGGKTIVVHFYPVFCFPVRQEPIKCGRSTR